MKLTPPRGPDDPPPSLPAVIPAAGLSLRMGRPKALLDAGGGTFLARVLAFLREGGCRPLLVVVRDPDGPVAEEALLGGATVLHNPHPGPGPITSLQAGIRALPPSAPGTAYCPLDHPLVRPSTVSALRAAFFASDAPAVVPLYQGRRGHPVLFRRSLFPELLEEGLPEGARTVVHRYLEQILEVHLDDPGVLADLNTPEAYRRHFP